MRKLDAVPETTSVWSLRGLSLRQLLRQLAREVSEDELLTRSAALSFYFIFAFFPMLLSLVVLIGFFARNQEVHIGIVSQFSQLMPATAVALVEKTVREISEHSSRWKLALGLLAAVWSGSSGVSAIIDALNRSYRVRESRPYWKRTLISLGLAAAISALSIAALAVFLTGGDLARFVGEHTGWSRATISLWQYAEWPIALLFVLSALALIYNLGPDLHRRWRWTTPGSLAAVLAWVAASLVFRMYVHYFSSYSRSYGSLGAVMVLLLWLYITGLAILAGGAIDAELSRASKATSQVSQ
ncbi:MAG TPA: YihY/virulence factor BrkB family protein [Candidatus Angelobacter sp.]|nr:YihY/virulence factor BrkB family protein [Candidatus Angelobacter sp.]